MNGCKDDAGGRVWRLGCCFSWPPGARTTLLSLFKHQQTHPHHFLIPVPTLAPRRQHHQIKHISFNTAVEEANVFVRVVLLRYPLAGIPRTGIVLVSVSSNAIRVRVTHKDCFLAGVDSCPIRIDVRGSEPKPRKAVRGWLAVGGPLETKNMSGVVLAR